MDIHKKATTKIRCRTGASKHFVVLLGVHQRSVLNLLLSNIIPNFLTSNVRTSAERKLMEVFDKSKNILENHEPSVTDSKNE